MRPALSPEAVYVHESVERDPRSLARAERMIGAMAPGQVLRHVTDGQLNAASILAASEIPTRWAAQYSSRRYWGAGRTPPTDAE